MESMDVASYVSNLVPERVGHERVNARARWLTARVSCALEPSNPPLHVHIISHFPITLELRIFFPAFYLLKKSTLVSPPPESDSKVRESATQNLNRGERSNSYDRIQ
ncbi:hypothetical protein YC2023_033983 [Brassica napus]